VTGARHVWGRAGRRILRGVLVPYAIVMLVCWLFAGDGGVEAQEPGTPFGTGMKAGLSSYDLDGTGTAFVVGPIGYVALSRHFLVQVGVPIFDYSRDVFAAGFTASERTRFLLPELDLQAQAFLGRFRPYLAIGGGAAIRLDGFTRGGATLHAGLGTRAVVGRRTLLRGEVRARSIRPWSGSTVDFTLGIEWASPSLTAPPPAPPD
jgi:hypothetical protein